MRRLSPLILAAAVFALGCGDRQPSTAPNAGPGGPRFDISDGAHDGNDDFFFMPPMVKEPTGKPGYKDEPFHAGLRPHVTICELATPTECAAGAAFKEFAPATVAVQDEKYQVSWDTKERPLVDGKTYRIQVFIGDVRLGYADVQHADRASELKNVNTNEFVPLVDGRTLPIKFRIETGALCESDAICTSTFVDKDAGGIFYAADDGAAIDLSPGVLPVDVVLTIERRPIQPGDPCVEAAVVGNRVFQQWEGCYRITTAPDIELFGGFQGPTEANPDVRAIVAVCIESDVPESLRENLLLYKYDAGRESPLQRPEPVQPPFPFSCEGFSGTSGGGGPIGFARDAMRFLASATSRLIGPRPLYALDGGLGCILAFGDSFSEFFWGLPLTATSFAGDGQSAPVGTPVAVPPAVSVRTFHADAEEDDEPVSGVPVTFAVTGGGGTLRDATGAAQSSVVGTTGSNGIATLPTGWVWEVGATAGENTLVASGPFESGPVTFTSTAVLRTGVAVTGTTFYSTTGLPNITVELIVGSVTDEAFLSATTDEAGHYSFSNVAPGTYWLKAYGPDASYITWVAQQITVAAGNVSLDIDVPKDIVLLSPASGSTVFTANPTLTWTANPQAVRYSLQLNITNPWTLVELKSLTSATYTVATPLLSEVNYTWQVDAFDATNHRVGTTEQQFNFTYIDPGAE